MPSTSCYKSCTSKKHEMVPSGPRTFHGLRSPGSSRRRTRAVDARWEITSTSRMNCIHYRNSKGNVGKGRCPNDLAGQEFAGLRKHCTARTLTAMRQRRRESDQDTVRTFLHYGKEHERPELMDNEDTAQEPEHRKRCQETKEHEILHEGWHPIKLTRPNATVGTSACVRVRIQIITAGLNNTAGHDQCSTPLQGGCGCDQKKMKYRKSTVPLSVQYTPH